MTSRDYLALLLVLCCTSANAQPPVSTASVTLDRNKIWLWDSVQLTLSVEGPAPMREAVGLPKQLLTDEADRNWRIRPKGDGAVAPLSDGRERWQQTFRLDPHAPGKPLRVAFAPIMVHGKTVVPPAVEVTVERTGAEEAPLPESLPVTSIEDPPDTPKPPAHTREVVVALFAAAVLAFAVLVVGVWRRTRRPKPIDPGAWARAALAELEAEHLKGADAAERLADVLRRFIERRFAVPAPKLTTSELSQALGAQEWPPDRAQLLRELLDQCDLAKFAGAAPDPESCRRLIRSARAWVDFMDPPAPVA
ncbi:MAG TPA: DUF4381 family protein [Gemmata sp.]